MLSKFSVKKPYTIVVAVVLILLLGGISFINLQTDLLPSIELPYLVVMTQYVGATPEEVEMVVTKPIEQIVATASNIKNINSISRENSSIVILEFENDVNMDSAIIEINGGLDLVKGAWGDSVGSPMIIKMNPDMLPIGIFSVDMEDKDVADLSSYIDQRIIPELESINGIASVTAVGLVEENIEVYIDSEKIEDLNEKVLNKVDKELSKAGGELNKARREINEGKEKLAQEEIAQRNKLEEGEKAIALAKDQMAALGEDNPFADQMKKEIAEGEEQIGLGRAALDSEMKKARAQLEEGERTLNQKSKEFENAKEEAFKKASLDGIITKDMISGILMAQNFSMPAGYIYEEGSDYIVKIGDKIEDIEEMEDLMLFDTGEDVAGKIYLKDVADVSYKDNSEDIYAKINGNNGVILTFQKQSNYSTTEVSKNIGKKIEYLTTDNEGLNFTTLMDQGIYIDVIVDSVMKNLIYGGLLAILVLIVFLRDIKPTFIIAVSIPISIVFAVAMMYFTGITINIISLAGLAMGVGMLVDNSIVVIENIYRLKSEGMSSVKASIEGARQISGAILSSTLTTVCVFLPIVFTKGISRQLFMDMGLTIAYSLLASLLVALTLVPAMASTMLKNTSEKEDKLFDKFISVYEKILKWSLDHRGLVLISVTALLGLSVFLGLSMGTAFIPEMETPQMSLEIKMPKGSSFVDTVNMSDAIVDKIIDIDGIETIGAFQASGMAMMAGSGGGSNDSMSMYLILDENKKISNKEIENQIMKATEDLDVQVKAHTSNMDMSALGGSGIEVLVKGRDLDTLRDIGGDVFEILKSTKGTAEVTMGDDDSLEEIRIIVDKEKAMQEGLTVAQVFGEIRNLLASKKTATTLSVANKDYPVIVVDGESEKITKDDIEDLLISVSKDGKEKEIKIGSIATIKEEKGLTSIRRKSQERYISVNAAIDKDHNIGIVSRDFEAKLKDYKAPEGYEIELSGENEMIKDSLRDLIYMILLAIAFIYLIMVAEFQSLLSPFIVMFTIPLAYTGGLLALVITGYELSLIAMLGFLVLAGVVVNNGIVFVDYTNQLREERDITTDDALVLAGKTRMRPILMTAITTILGLSTLSAGVGMGAEIIQPLAITAIGGLIYATLLTLVVIPVMYSLLHKKKIKRVFLEGTE